MIIHQIWLQGRENVPKKYLNYSNMLKNMNKRYQHIIWDEKTFYDKILNKYPEYKKFYEMLPLIHLKVDYMRYIILFIIGGIYVDMDAKPMKSFDSIRNLINKYETVLCKLKRTKTESIIITGHTEVINNGVIISKPNSIFLKKLIETVQKNIMKYKVEFILAKEKRLTSTILIDKITGPQVFTKNYFSIPKNIRNKKIKILDSEYFEPCGNTCNPTKNTIIFHEQDMSWLPEGFKNTREMYENKNILLPVIITLIIILCLLPILNLYFLIVSIPLIIFCILILICRLV